MLVSFLRSTMSAGTGIVHGEGPRCLAGELDLRADGNPIIAIMVVANGQLKVLCSMAMVDGDGDCGGDCGCGCFSDSYPVCQLVFCDNDHHHHHRRSLIQSRQSKPSDPTMQFTGIYSRGTKDSVSQPLDEFRGRLIPRQCSYVAAAREKE